MTKKKPKKQTRAIGRPTVFTEEVVRKLEEAFMMDATDTEACAFAGIGRTAYYDELKRNEAFVNKMERAQQVPFMVAKKGLFNAMQKEDGHLILKWLERRQRDRYHTKVENENVEKPRDAAAELAEEMIARAKARQNTPADERP